MHKLLQKVCLITTLLFTLVSIQWVYATGVKKSVQFEKGKSSAVIKGAVVRGDRDEYTLSAKANQTMTVSISSVENNAAFDVYAPASAEGEDPLGHVEQDSEKNKPAVWQGSLPSKGEYVISVGGTRGNVSYTLKISITH